MLIAIDVVTRKKLILVKQMYQRALTQSFTRHSPVSRIFSVVGFDLANETVLKAVVSALNPVKNLANDFQGVLSQAESELTPKGVTIPDKVKIQHVRTLRNDAQHKAKYPSDVDVNDCRTYTRDFLAQTFQDVWGEPFDSFSLVDAIQNTVALKHLKEAEIDLSNSDYVQVVAKSLVAFEIMIRNVANSFTNNIGYYVSAILVTENSKGAKANRDVFNAFMKTRDLIAFQTIGINSQDYLRFKRYTRFIHVSIAYGGSFTTTITGEKPMKEEAEYVLNFVTDSIIQVENLDNDILKPYDRLS